MNKFVDIQSLIHVALGLQELREKVVFVGFNKILSNSILNCLQN
jgi:hypothetical protein